MAKKKRPAPTKPCPKCKTKLHARRMTCSKCGYDFPASKKKVTRRKKVSQKRTTVGNNSDVQSVLREEKKRLEKRLEAVNSLLE